MVNVSEDVPWNILPKIIWMNLMPLAIYGQNVMVL